mmetsp:Transcript_135773/g.321761  ORF Transcript_135773/g.321761 Transcript_135773/m.321761 type:complete len:307 (-) Transcript_135773:309-1229(-)
MFQVRVWMVQKQLEDVLPRRNQCSVSLWVVVASPRVQLVDHRHAQSAYADMCAMPSIGISAPIDVDARRCQQHLDHLQVALGQHHVVAAGQRESEDAASPSLFPQPSQRKCQRGNGLAVVSLVLVHVRFGQNFLHLLGISTSNGLAEAHMSGPLVHFRPAELEDPLNLLGFFLEQYAFALRAQGKHIGHASQILIVELIYKDPASAVGILLAETGYERCLAPWKHLFLEELELPALLRIESAGAGSLQQPVRVLQGFYGFGWNHGQDLVHELPACAAYRGSQSSFPIGDRDAAHEQLNALAVHLWL